MGAPQEWIGSAISGGAGILSNALNLGAIGIQNRYNNQQWEKTNEYNSPKNQVSRMREAGLNPALMYGSGSSGGGTAAPAPTSERRSVDLTQIGNIVGTYLDLKKKDTDIENTRQQTANIKEDWIGKTLINDQGMSNDWKNTEDKASFTPAFRKYMVDLENQEKEGKLKTAREPNIQKDTELKEQQRKSSELQNWLPEAQKARYEKLGILPEDDGNVQMFKEAYYGITGNKLDSSASKSPALGKVLSTIFGKYGKSGKAVQSAVKKNGLR